MPCPPPLTELLQAHLAEFGTAADGRLVRGVRGDDVSDSTYGRVWKKARELALTPEEAASPLARRPYDLRHAAVSTWLNGGVPATQVAEWAGHSVMVLLRVYAKCIAGQGDIAREQIGRALGSDEGGASSEQERWPRGMPTCNDALGRSDTCSAWYHMILGDCSWGGGGA